MVRHKEPKMEEVKSSDTLGAREKGYLRRGKWIGDERFVSGRG